MAQNPDKDTQKIIQEMMKATQDKSKKELLIVEDNLLIARMWENKLKKRGYQKIHMAATGLEGIEKFKELKPDLVMLDVIMPGIDGFTTCERMRKLESEKGWSHGKAIIFFLSNLLQANAREKALSIGAEDFYSKSNVSPEDLACIVDEFLGFKYQKDLHEIATEVIKSESDLDPHELFIKQIEIAIAGQEKQLEELAEKKKAINAEIKALKDKKKKYQEAREKIQEIKEEIDELLGDLNRSSDHLTVAKSGFELLAKIVKNSISDEVSQETEELIIERLAIAISKSEDNQGIIKLLEKNDLEVIVKIYSHSCFTSHNDSELVDVVLKRIEKEKGTDILTEERAKELRDSMESSYKEKIIFEEKNINKIRTNMQTLLMK